MTNLIVKTVSMSSFDWPTSKILRDDEDILYLEGMHLVSKGTAFSLFFPCSKVVLICSLVAMMNK